MRRIERFTITGARTTLSIDIASGTIEVRATADAVVTVNLDTEHAGEWDISQLGDLVTVRAPRRRGFRNRSAKVFIETPSGTHLEIAGASADMSLAGSLGDVRIRTASGDVRADEVQSLDVGTASGDVKVDRVVGRLAVSTASGDVAVQRCAGDIDVGTASGDVRIGRYDGDAVNVKVISGDISLGLPPGIRVEPDISTLSGRTKLPSRPALPSTEPRRPVRVHLRSVSGDIAIERVDRG
jgi:hypothetical protein